MSEAMRASLLQCLHIKLAALDEKQQVHRMPAQHRN